jgi:hypothetical protein
MKYTTARMIPILFFRHRFTPEPPYQNVQPYKARAAYCVSEKKPLDVS